MICTGLVLCVISALQGGDPAQSPAPAARPALLSRVAVIGASASAGFKLKVNLADAFEAQIAIEHTTPVSFADERLFLEPVALGEEQISRAAALDPTLVIGADFLFWFGYGELGGDEQRLEQMELGLELLEALKCPLIVSRLPDMSPAVGKMLMPTQMPSKAALVMLNARIDLWAAKRRNVVFVPMPEYLDSLRAGEALTLGGVEFKAPASRRRLMQSDELHPTPEGLGTLARLCVDAALGAQIGAVPEAFKLDLAPALESLRKLDESRRTILRLPPPKPTDSPSPPPKPVGGGHMLRHAIVGAR